MTMPAGMSKNGTPASGKTFSRNHAGSTIEKQGRMPDIVVLVSSPLVPPGLCGPRILRTGNAFVRHGILWNLFFLEKKKGFS